jgi:hypothetical protein
MQRLRWAGGLGDGGSEDDATDDIGGKIMLARIGPDTNLFSHLKSSSIWSEMEE